MARRLLPLKDEKRREKVKDLLGDLQSAVKPNDLLYWITVCSTTLILIEELAILDYKLLIAFVMGFALCFITSHGKNKDGEAEEG